ncbi:hypothetical protein Pint_18640 [Pistacia integerrima]|uniref:Uncharacterized protein n=1 Tax=Pistacia integerrima TaxID=434235 RepID=A0ACC0YZ26_9ROSI|nr:hypothetical protein Pint_18640 [Pistacia integerrima]
MDEQLFDAICNRLKPVLHTDESYIVREVTGGGKVPSFLQTCNLMAGDFIGEELISWGLDPQSSFKDLPISKRTVKALTEWRTWAAAYIQAAWRRYTKKKLEESLRAEEYKLQNELAKPGGIAPNLGVTIYATRFSANILRARRRNGKAEMLERVPAMLLQKPDEPDVSDEEPHR